MGKERLVVIGGSAAGARAAEAALKSGFPGQVVVVSRDVNAPYYRPSLSKQLLKGTWQRAEAAQPMPRADNLVWRSGVSAVGLDVDGRTVALDDGRTLDFDRLVLAGGCRPRRLPGLPGNDLLPAVHTMDDVEAIISRLRDGGSVVVIGAGLIGSEVASTLGARGVRVAVVDPSPAPLARALGPVGNDVCVALHRANGIDLRLGTAVERVVETGDGIMVRLQAGETLRADAAVLCIGVVPDTEWLEGSGVPVLADGGIDCDANLIVRGTDVAAAAGDVASWESACAGRKVRVEHWLTAVEQGAAAARNVLVQEDERTAFDGVPMFWTEQHGKLVHVLGYHGPESTWRVLEGTPRSDGMVAAATIDGRITGYLMVNAARRLGHYRQQMLQMTVSAAGG